MVFMRAANVGGHQVFRPAALAKALAAWDVVNIGAAGTFAVRKSATPKAFGPEFLARLPFRMEFMLLRGGDLEKLIATQPFAEIKCSKDLRPFVSVLAKRPAKEFPFPMDQPEGENWQVRIIGMQGRFVLSLWRRRGKTLLYPNAVVEKTLGLPATTRTWETILKLQEVLRKT